MEFLCLPSKNRGYIVLLMQVGLSVGRSVDQMVSNDYLKYHLSQSLIFHIQIGHDQQITPIDFGVTRSKVNHQGHGGICVVQHLLLMNIFTFDRYTGAPYFSAISSLKVVGYYNLYLLGMSSGVRISKRSDHVPVPGCNFRIRIFV